MVFGWFLGFVITVSYRIGVFIIERAQRERTHKIVHIRHCELIGMVSF